MSYKQTVGSITVTLIFTRALFRPLSVGGVAVLSAHELGHYYLAKDQGLSPEAPVILGVGPVGFGYVKTRRGTSAQRQRIGLAGPVAGITTGLCSLLLFALVGFKFGVIVATFCVVSEMINLLYGPDSRRVFS